MSTLGAIWKTAGWIGLVCGLYLNGNLNDEKPPAKPIRIEMGEAAERIELPQPLRDQEKLPCALAVRLPSSHVNRFINWIEGPPSGSAKVTFVDDDGKPADVWTVEGEEFQQLDTDGTQGMIVAEGTCTTKNASWLQVQSNISGTFFQTHKPSIIIGNREDDGLSESVSRWVRRRDKRPGLMILSGGSLVFLHVFFVLARLIIPYRDTTEFDATL